MSAKRRKLGLEAGDNPSHGTPTSRQSNDQMAQEDGPVADPDATDEAPKTFQDIVCQPTTE